MIGNLFEETYFFNFLLFLLHIRILGKSSLTFCRNFSAMLLNLQFTCSDEHSDEKMILKIVFFRSLSKFFPDFLQKIFCKNGRSAFSAFRRTLWCTTTSFKKHSSFFEFWSKLFLNFRILLVQKCEKCFLRTDTNTSIKKIFFEKFSSFIGMGSKVFLTFGKKSTERLSELFSTCSETCWRNRLFQFFFSFHCVIGLWPKLF